MRSLLLIPLLLLLPAELTAASPHEAESGVECLECHALGQGAWGVSLPRGTDQELLCKSCHNPTGQAAAKSDVAMHPTGAGVVDCGSCHFVHFPQPVTDPHAGGATAPNLSLVRPDTGAYVPGALEPALLQVRPEHFAFTEPPFNGICQSCHTQTAYHRNDGSADTSHNAGSDCTSCHPHDSGFGSLDHEAAGVVTAVPSCMECHGAAGSDPVEDVHRAQCGLCHVDPLGAGPLVEPWETTTPGGGDCIDCHGTLAEAHPAVSHTATPGTGWVMIFADDDHDDAGWFGPKPYFDVQVTCAQCHSTSLTQVHGGVCATCHPTAYGALGPVGSWGGGCQQGACHASYHGESTTAHWEFSDPFDGGNDCSVCHGPGFGSVTQAACGNCHAPVSAGDATPPVTSCDAKASYVGPARIDFSVKDGGKVAVATTFRRLDGGPQLAGSAFVVEEPGAHTLSFWSVDQAGNVEAPPKQASFTVLADTTPPVTTSNAQAAYWQTAWITLSATDASTLGVKATWWSLDDGPATAGTVLSVPAVSGTVPHTLRFWSEDWAGNVETPKTASFTVTGGTGTLRLVWGDSDVTGFPADPEAWAEWWVRKGGYSGQLVAHGSGSNPGWSGVEDIVVPVSPTPYYVRIDWWDSYWGWDDQTVFPSVLVNTPGQVVRLSY